ncbi:MAG: hydrogenase 3 maturation endopeptidase HyCI [bacterium]
MKNDYFKDRSNINFLPLQALRDHLKGRVVLLGVGNRIRGDDAAGPKLIEILKKRLPDKGKEIFLFDGEEVPENYLIPIANLKPNLVIIVDAVNFGSRPGIARLFPIRQVPQGSFSTHRLSLRFLCSYLEKETQAKIYLLGIQPKSIKLEEKLSPEVKKTLRDLADFFEKNTFENE